MKGERVLEGSPVEGQVGSQPRPRFWLIGLVMFGIIVVILVGAFLLNRQFRPRVGIEPVATPLASSQAQARATPVVAVQPTAQPSPTAPAASTPTIVPITQAPSGAAPVAKPTADPAVAKEVEQAYLKYWQVYGDALLSLDTSRVPDVAMDEELRRIQEQVDSFKQRKQAVRVDVSHRYFVFDVSGDDAKVYDEITNRSWAVDAVTKEPSKGPGESDLEKDTYFFKKIDGTWRVTKSVTQRGG